MITQDKFYLITYNWFNVYVQRYVLLIIEIIIKTYIISWCWTLSILTMELYLPLVANTGKNTPLFPV